MENISVVAVKQVRERTLPYNVRSIRQPEDAYSILCEAMALHEEAIEKFGVLLLDTKCDVNAIQIISAGTLDQTIVHPRSVFQAAVLANARQMILFHNHPSGDPKASRADVDITLRLIDASRIMGIPIIDHIIVGDGTFYSMRAHGDMPAPEEAA